MAETQAYIGTLVIVTCCHDECGIAFGIDREFYDRRRNDHKLFYCPHGHSQWFSGKSEKEKLEDQVNSLRETLDFRSQENMHLVHKLRAERGVKTRIMNRVKNGVCPCCNRSFKDLQRHFESKHPEYLVQK